MSNNHLEYLKVLETVDNTYPPATGFSASDSVTTTGDKIIISQNNIRIELLLSLHSKIDRLSGHTSPLPPDLTQQLENLTKSLSQFSVTKKPTISSSKQQLVVWKDPRTFLPK